MVWKRSKAPTIANMGHCAPERNVWRRRSGSCPVTCGRPTRMLLGTFSRMCVGNQEEEDSSCRFICGGMWPPAGLEFIVLEDELQKRENDMGNVNRKSGVCQVCGQKKIVERVAGIEACSVCTFVARAVKNTPEFVVSEMQRQHGVSYFPGSVDVDAGEIERLKNELQEANRIRHAAEKVIEDLREVFGCGDDESVMAAAIRVRQERQMVVSATPDDKAEIELLKNKLKIYENAFFELRGILECGDEETPVEAANRIRNERQVEHDYVKSCSDRFGKMLEMMGKPQSADPVFELGLIMDEYYALKDHAPIEAVLESTDDGPYTSLRRGLDLAFQQAASGKGQERHAKAGEPFERQKICEIARRVGLAFPIGQAVKKSEESLRVGGEWGIRENLGAINYLAAAVIVMEEAASGPSTSHVPV